LDVLVAHAVFARGRGPVAIGSARIGVAPQALLVGAPAQGGGSGLVAARGSLPGTLLIGAGPLLPDLRRGPLALALLLAALCVLLLMLADPYLMFAPLHFGPVLG